MKCKSLIREKGEECLGCNKCIVTGEDNPHNATIVGVCLLMIVVMVILAWLYK